MMDLITDDSGGRYLVPPDKAEEWQAIIWEIEDYLYD